MREMRQCRTSVEAGSGPGDANHGYAHCHSSTRNKLRPHDARESPAQRHHRHLSLCLTTRQGDTAMRCFVQATDDEIYAFIARYGMDALQPYSVGMRVAAPEPAPNASPEPRAWRAEQEPRLAA